ncbi:MAG: hypothetical protein ACAH11_05020 [Sphingomonas sp.]
MIVMFLSAALTAASPIPCPIPESLPAPIESLAGAGDPDWCMKGEDVFSQAGPNAHPMRQIALGDLTTDVFQVLQWRSGAPTPVPADWRQVFEAPGRVGTGGPGMFEERLIQRFGDNLITITPNRAWRIGNAVCAAEGGPIIAYLPRGIAPTEGDQQWIDALPGTRSSLEPDAVMCMLLTRDVDGYRMNFRGPQGRPLYDVDDFYQNSRARIVAPGDFERYLGINR